MNGPSPTVKMSDADLRAMLLASRYDAVNQTSARYQREAEMQVSILTELLERRASGQVEPGAKAKPVAWLSQCVGGPYLGEYDVEIFQPDQPFNELYGPWFPVCAAPQPLSTNTDSRASSGEEASEKLDAASLERRLRLWFFRDLSADQRQGLFKLCGYPVDETGQTHAIQQITLQHLIKSLTSPSPALEVGEAVRNAVWQAVLSCPHSITGEEIVLGYSSDKPGNNAADQLHSRISAALEEAARGETVTGADIYVAAHALEMGTDLSLSWQELCTVASVVLQSYSGRAALSGSKS